MKQVQVKSTSGVFTQEVQVGTHILLADVSKEDGGDDYGASPHELIAASLGSCTAITLKMYAKRKNWDVSGLEVSVLIEEKQGESIFRRNIKLPHSLSDEQRQRLFSIAQLCPIHKLLSGKIVIESQLS